MVSVAKRDPVDVRKALRRFQQLEADEPRAIALVEMAYDVDAATVMPFLQAFDRIRDDAWRARTLFSVFEQLNRKLGDEMPIAAQDAVLALVDGVRDEAARAAALRRLAENLPTSLRDRLAARAESLTDALARLRTVLAYEAKPSADRAGALLQAAKSIEDEAQRGEALALLAPRLQAAQLEEALAAARSINDPGLSGRALVGVARAIADEGRRQQAQLEILERSSSIDDPVRRFDVLAALRELPPDTKRATEARLLELARQFADPVTRSRALFMAGDFAEDEVLRKSAFLDGIASAESVSDLRVRAELLALLRPVGPWLHPDIRREARRAVERLPDPEIQRELRDALSRFFFHDPPKPADEPPAADPDAARPAALPRVRRWDVFISYATADLEEARSLAWELKSRGLRVFLSADSLDAEVGSRAWITAIDDAIESSRAMLVLLTANTLASKWVPEEWRKYYHLLVDRQSGRLLSLRLSGPPIAELPLTLRTYQIIDSETGRVESADVTRILDLVRDA